MRRNAVLASIDREQQAEMRKGLLNLQALSLVGRSGQGLSQVENKLQYYWGLAVRIGCHDVSALDEWTFGAEVTSDQKKLLDLFNKLEAEGALELTEEELADM